MMYVQREERDVRLHVWGGCRREEGKSINVLESYNCISNSHYAVDTVMRKAKKNMIYIGWRHIV